MADICGNMDIHIYMSYILISNGNPEMQSHTVHNLNTVGFLFNRNMSNSKGWTLQSSLLMLWMEKTRVNNQTTIDDKWKTY